MTRKSANYNSAAALWLLTDVCLNLTALSIVKLTGGEFSAFQLVFIRACTGLIFIIPFLIPARNDLYLFSQTGLQLLRCSLAAISLTFSYHAVTHLPLALFSTLNYTRPLLLMIFAVFLLHERITSSRWIAGIVGLIGAGIAANPANIPWTSAMASLVIAIVTGTLAVVVLRKLKGCPWQTVMLYYAGGVLVLSALPAYATWHQPDTKQWWLLLLLGAFTQCAQFCFMRAHWLGDAGFLGPLGYFSLLLSAAAGFVVFSEVPTPHTITGAFIIVAATLLLSRTTAQQGYRQSP